MYFPSGPETFTMRELQALYESVYDRPFTMNNFQKKMLDLRVLERLEKKFTGAQHKAPYLYRFIKAWRFVKTAALCPPDRACDKTTSPRQNGIPARSSHPPSVPFG